MSASFQPKQVVNICITCETYVFLLLIIVLKLILDTHGAHLLLLLELTFNVGLIVWNGGGLEVVCCILE